MKKIIEKIFIIIVGLGISVMGLYYLKYYYEKQEFIKKYGKSAWLEDERVYGTAKNKIMSTLLYNTWWTPVLCIAIGGFIVYGGLKGKKDIE